MRRLKGDEWGAVLVQTLLILPVLILIVFGGYTVWKIASVKHSLHSGTYQATRYLCLNPVDSRQPEIWADVVEEIVAREVGNNGLARGAFLRPVIVLFSDALAEGGLGCGANFTFTVKTQMDLQIDIPYLSMPPQITLRDQHEGWVECR
jgi:Flp pilus assembly protein TadG